MCYISVVFLRHSVDGTRRGLPMPSTVMPPPAVTLTIDLLTPKYNQHIYEAYTHL